jgi:hypothetical protein
MLMYPLLMRLAPLLIAAIAAIVAASTGVRAADAVEPGEETIARVLAKGFAPPKVAPPRGDEARGPFEKLLITNAILVDGTGAPPVGPWTSRSRGTALPPSARPVAMTAQGSAPMPR